MRDLWMNQWIEGLLESPEQEVVAELEMRKPK